MPVNFRVVEPGVLYRSGAINPNELEALTKSPYHITKVISLDYDTGKQIAPTLQKLGVEHIFLPIRPEGDVRDSSMKLYTLGHQIFAPPKKGGAILIHCRHGRDRTGFAVALFREMMRGWPCDRAIKEAEQYGYGQGLSIPVKNQFNSVLCRACKVSHTHICTKVTKQAFEDLAHYVDLFCVLAEEGKVSDLSKRLEEKKKQDEQKKMQEQLGKTQTTGPEPPPAPLDELAKKRKEKATSEFTSEVHQETGVWMHRFSDIRKDDQGFFILKQDDPSGPLMAPGQLLADYAVNLTPYWKITSIQGDRINLEPIGNNPFLTGVGAGGAKITDLDISVFTGAYEKKRLEYAAQKMAAGTATIDDVIYLLEGTVPTNIGPNGAQGGWYHAYDTRANRGGHKGMSDQEIMVHDAKKLVEWGFTGIPQKALNGTMAVDDWDQWVSSNSGKEETYVPKDLEAYVDFHRKMTEKGVWRYDEPALRDLRRRHSLEHTKEHWENIIKDFVSLPHEEYQAKYPYYPKTLAELVAWAEQDINKKEKELKERVYLSAEEEPSEESVLKNIFHKERRVAIRNTKILINMAMENPAYTKYLHDMVKLGGSDWFANEQVINFFDQTDDVEGLKLAADHLQDPTNLRYAYSALIRHQEADYVLGKINVSTPLEVLAAVLSNYKRQLKTEPAYRNWLVEFVPQHNIFAAIDEQTQDIHDFNSRYQAEETLKIMRSAFNYLWEPAEKDKYKDFIAQIDERLDKLEKKSLREKVLFHKVGTQEDVIDKLEDSYYLKHNPANVMPPVQNKPDQLSELTITPQQSFAPFVGGGAEGPLGKTDSLSSDDKITDRKRRLRREIFVKLLKDKAGPLPIGVGNRDNYNGVSDSYLNAPSGSPGAPNAAGPSEPSGTNQLW